MVDNGFQEGEPPGSHHLNRENGQIFISVRIRPAKKVVCILSSITSILQATCPAFYGVTIARERPGQGGPFRLLFHSATHEDTNG